MIIELILRRAESAVDITAANKDAKIMTTSQYPKADCCMICRHIWVNTVSEGINPFPANSFFKSGRWAAISSPIITETKAVISGMKAIAAKDRLRIPTFLAA